MTKLETINLVLSAVGLEAINDDVDTQGDYEVAQVSFMIEQARREVLTQNFFTFSTYVTTWQPDANNEIRVPNGTLWWTPLAPNDRGVIVEHRKGDPLYNRELNVVHQYDTDVVYTQNIAIDQIPDVIAYWIAWRAAEIFSFKLNGTEANLAFIRNEKMMARLKALNSEWVITDAMSEFNLNRQSFLY